MQVPVPNRDTAIVHCKLCNSIPVLGTYKYCWYVCTVPYLLPMYFILSFFITDWYRTYRVPVPHGKIQKLFYSLDMDAKNSCTYNVSSNISRKFSLLRLCNHRLLGTGSYKIIQGIGSSCFLNILLPRSVPTDYKL